MGARELSCQGEEQGVETKDFSPQDNPMRYDDFMCSHFYHAGTLRPREGSSCVWSAAVQEFHLLMSTLLNNRALT